MSVQLRPHRGGRSLAALAVLLVALLQTTAAQAGSCGNTKAHGFSFADIRTKGMSCSEAKKVIRKGGVGAHGFQRYAGWVCTDVDLSYTCRKRSKSFTFKLKTGVARATTSATTKSCRGNAARLVVALRAKNTGCGAARWVAFAGSPKRENRGWSCKVTSKQIPGGGEVQTSVCKKGAARVSWRSQ